MVSTKSPSLFVGTDAMSRAAAETKVVDFA
jgi:hypothetical protein